MAERKRNVVVEKLAGCMLSVYSDLSLAQIQNVEGVRFANTLNNLIAVDVDPRYDPAEVAQEIRDLAEAQAQQS